MTAVDAEQGVAELLRRAALARMLAHCMAEPRGDHRGAVLSLLEQLGAVDDLARGGGWAGAYEAARAAWAAASAEQLPLEYARLFLRGGGCPPHETAYGDGRRPVGQATELADIGGFLRAFGLELSEADPELPDHISTELELLSVLLLQQAYGLAEGDAEQAETALRAARSFLQDHLGRWPESFREALETAGGAAPYAETARLIEAVVRHECARFGAEPAPAGNPAPQSPLEDCAMTCPLAEAPAARR